MSLLVLRRCASFVTPQGMSQAATSLPTSRLLLRHASRLVGIAAEPRQREFKPRDLQATHRVRQQLLEAPQNSGVYIMKGNDDEILYIGKSVDVRSRVGSYFRKVDGMQLEPAAQLTQRIAFMIKLVHNLEFIETSSASEALLLEASLVRAHQPPFNVLLKDDKRYPYVCITWSKEYPEIFITRRKSHKDIEKGDRYFGPFPDGSYVRSLLSVIKSVFPLRQRPVPLYRDKPCLNYSIGKCPGVCQRLISPEVYRSTMSLVQMVFEGRIDDAVTSLVAVEKISASEEDFEKATRYRDMAVTVQKALQGGTLHFSSLPGRNSSLALETGSVDVIGAVVSDFTNGKQTVFVHIIKVRNGRINVKIAYNADLSATRSTESEIERGDAYTSLHVASVGFHEEALAATQQILESHYAELSLPDEYPGCVLLPEDLRLPDLDMLREFLQQRRGDKPVRIINGGTSADVQHLLSFATQHAQQESKKIQVASEGISEALWQLAEMLKLPSPPVRIEGIDISHTQGTGTVASCVVFVDGEPALPGYRKYRLRTPVDGTPDDCASISEVMKRRFKIQGPVNDLSVNTRKAKTLEWPDVILIDGGKGQLNAAASVMDQLGWSNSAGGPLLISLAKQLEQVFVLGEDSPINEGMDVDSPAMRLLRRVRDEAHRFAVSYHRTLRKAAAFQSAQPTVDRQAATAPKTYDDA